jgi:hypothetical protein
MKAPGLSHCGALGGNSQDREPTKPTEPGLRLPRFRELACIKHLHKF